MGPTEYCGVTITDLSRNVYNMAHKSIESFIKFHDNNRLLVYIIGDKELNSNYGDNVQVVHIPYTNYNIQYPVPFEKCSNSYFRKIDTILIEKLLCFTRHTNCVFFENDVFFLNSITDTFNKIADGIHGSPAWYQPTGINTGFVIIKNLKLQYTINDIRAYLESKAVHWLDEEFLRDWVSLHDNNVMHPLDFDINIPVNDYVDNICKVFHANPITVHFTGSPKIYTSLKDHADFDSKFYKHPIVAYFRNKVYSLLGK